VAGNAAEDRGETNLTGRLPVLYCPSVLQIGSGNTSERIRTYNFPSSRITDHRINLSLFGLERMFNGEMLGEIIEELNKDERRKQLQAL
jgi:protein subunit release factor A